MNKILSLLVGVTLVTTTIYNFSVTDSDGNNISLEQFRGKKILFVNVATSCSYTSQFASLEQLYQKYKDSLIIIAIPSNSFGNESRNNTEIKEFVTSNYDTHFIITEKNTVTGDGQIPLYSWITHIEQNGTMNNPVGDDFYKFLVDGSGKLIGGFVSSVDPMSEDIQTAITN